MTPDNKTTSSSSAPAPAAPRPFLPPTPPQSPDVACEGGSRPETRDDKSVPGRGFQGFHASHASLDTAQSSQNHQEYLDSLIVPPKEELQRIAEIQTQREAQHKQYAREAVRSTLAQHTYDSPHSRGDSTSGLEQMAPTESQQTKSMSPSPDQEPDSNDGTRHNAAALIQRTYRGYRVRREVQGMGLDASTRWTHAVRDAQWREITRPRARSDVEGLEMNGAPGDGHVQGGLSARQKWKKAAVIARRAGLDIDDDNDSGSLSSSSSSSSSGHHRTDEQKRAAAREKRAESRATHKKVAMTMGLPYFLEMVDVKHRYGSNLRTYHEEWKQADTNENFFYWLDYGAGRNIDMEGCPRERLDREQVRYLSREERQYYLVKTDAEGRLCWAKNGIRIDTTEKWKDSIHGIVPADDPTPAFNPIPGEGPRDSDSDAASSSSGASESELEAARAAKYATPGLDEAHGIRKVKHISAATVLDRLLRKTVKKNTWIFVADTNFRLYVGIKASGAFQHSSFLQGSRIAAAGLVKIKNGRLTSLSPLSGHYRPPASNFRAFVRNMRQSGVDTSRVSISKSYAVLVGLEAYVKTRRKGKALVKKITHRKDKLIAPQEVRRREEAALDQSESAQKEREFLEKQRHEESAGREENRATLHLLQKLRIAPQEPAGGPEAEDEEKNGRAQLPQ